MSYWLLDWLDSENATSSEDAARLVAADDALERAISFASSRATDELVAPTPGKTLVAGTGIDLSGVMSCRNPECLRQTVDSLVQRTWFFFDHVVVIGLDPVEFIYGSESPERARTDLLDHAAIALSIRSMGGEEFFTFRRRPHFCMDHLDQHAHDAGLGSSATELSSAMAQELRRDGEVRLLERDGSQMYVFRHPALEFLMTGSAEGTKTLDDVRDMVAEREAKRFVAALTTSVWSARENNAALGQTVWANSKILQPPTSAEVNPASVAFNVTLPVLDGVPAATLLSLRRHEADEFVSFRGAITATIEERIAAMPLADSRAVGESVVSDVLMPEVSRLQRRMESAADLLGKRSLASVTTGSLLTTVGLLAFAPLAVPGILLGVGGLLGSYNAYAKEKSEVDVSDLHILWRAGQKPHG